MEYSSKYQNKIHIFKLLQYERRGSNVIWHKIQNPVNRTHSHHWGSTCTPALLLSLLYSQKHAHLFHHSWGFSHDCVLNHVQLLDTNTFLPRAYVLNMEILVPSLRRGFCISYKCIDTIPNHITVKTNSIFVSLKSVTEVYSFYQFVGMVGVGYVAPFWVRSWMYIYKPYVNFTTKCITPTKHSQIWWVHTLYNTVVLVWFRTFFDTFWSTIFLCRSMSSSKSLCFMSLPTLPLNHLLCFFVPLCCRFNCRFGIT